MRMGMRRFTRLTNGFSKKIENHSAAVAIHLMHYNFARIHKTLRIAPAMAAGVSDHLWSLEEIISLANGDTTHRRAQVVPVWRENVAAPPSKPIQSPQSCTSIFPCFFNLRKALRVRPQLQR